jgi:hypothetical protein
MFPSALAEEYGLRSSRPRRKVPVRNSGALVSLFVNCAALEQYPHTYSSDFFAMHEEADWVGDNICKLRV